MNPQLILAGIEVMKLLAECSIAASNKEKEIAIMKMKSELAQMEILKEIKRIESQKEVILELFKLIQHIFDGKLEAIKAASREACKIFEEQIKILQVECSSLNEKLLTTKDKETFAIISRRINEIELQRSELNKEFRIFNSHNNKLIANLEIPEVLTQLQMLFRQKDIPALLEKNI